jgi:heat shock protein HslJ
MLLRSVLLGSFALATALVGVVAIASGTIVSDGQANSPKARWRVDGFDPDGSDDRYPTLYISNDAYDGYAMCNKFEGKVTFDGNSIAFGKEVITFRNACVREDIEQEAKFLSALAAVRSWRIDTSNGTALILSSADGLPLITLGRMRVYVPF